MKLFTIAQEDEGSSMPIDYVTVVAGPAELRLLSRFFLACAEGMEDDPDWNHEHLIDYLGESLESDIVVVSDRLQS